MAALQHQFAQEDALFVLPDGRILFLGKAPGGTRWIFSSGSPLHSSYQAFFENDGSDIGSGGHACVNFDSNIKNSSGLGKEFETKPYSEVFLDVGEDGGLYRHRKRNGTWESERIANSMEEYFYTNNQKEFNEGVVILKEKRITTFLVDAKTGMLESPSVQSAKDKLALRGGHHQIFIIRTDFILRGYHLGCELWNSTIANVEAPFSPEIKVLVSYWHGWSPKIPEISASHDAPTYTLPDEKKLGSKESTFTKREDDFKDTESFQLESYERFNGQNIPSSPVRVGWSYPIHSTLFSAIVLVLSVLVFVKIMQQMKSDTQRKSDEQSNLSEHQFPVVRKKKTRRRTHSNHGSIINKPDKLALSENEERKTNGFLDSQEDDKNLLVSLVKGDEFGEGRWVGKLFVSNVEIAKGSNGTIVFEGVYNRHRIVAVKRLILAHNDVAFKEIDHLIISDRHPNIVRWYGVEQDLDFVYLALERCSCNLNDFIQLNLEVSVHRPVTDGRTSNTVSQHKVRLNSLNGVGKDIELWKTNGRPSPLLMKLMRDVVSGLAHLHDLGIIHRDLKPHNVLISTEGTLCAKLSDMGTSKRLSADMSSLGNHATGYGSPGWQAPEQLQNERQTRAADLFSLGCVLFFCITGGRHPFGDYLERDINIVKNRVDFFLVEHIPEAVDLFSQLLDPMPKQRLKAKEVLSHPLFWNSEIRLSFLRDASDRVESEDKEGDSKILKELEIVAPVIFGGSWGDKLETRFIDDLGRYRKYKPGSVRDLLRVIRNKLSHYRDLQADVKELLGSLPVGFDGYFTIRFPKLLIEVYKVIHKYCKEEECFLKYFNSDSKDFHPLFGGVSSVV
ncbi:serine/threonine-protein kinase/endoribonuclease IRE1a-like isoform X2 [Aristolochia californica]